MLRIDVYDSELNAHYNVGTVAEFTEAVILAMGSVATVVTKKELRKKALGAIDTVLQKARDTK